MQILLILSIIVAVAALAVGIASIIAAFRIGYVQETHHGDITAQHREMAARFWVEVEQVKEKIQEERK